MAGGWYLGPRPWRLGLCLFSIIGGSSCDAKVLPGGIDLFSRRFFSDAFFSGAEFRGEDGEIYGVGTAPDGAAGLLAANA